MASKILDACGAYGRQYKAADWEAGKDMKIIDGPYFSIRDTVRLKSDGYTRVRFSHVVEGKVVAVLVSLT